MWTTRIFLAIVFSGVGFLLWFLTGLIREELGHRRRVRALAIPRELRTRQLRPAYQARTMPAGQKIATVRTVLWPGAQPVGSARKEPSCGI